MANITTQNNIRYQIDKLNSRHYGVLIRTNDAPIDLTNADKVSGITITGTQPSGTSRYIAFCINDTWGKISTSGTFSPFTQNSTDFDYLEENANTPAELSALTNIPALAGKKFTLAIALSSNDPDNVLPTCGVAFQCVAGTQQLSAEELSPVYSLGDEAQIISLSAETSTSNGGSVTVEARALKPDGTYTEWQSLDAYSGLKAAEVQLRGTYKAQQVGVSTAKINTASIVYTNGGAVMSGMQDGEIITISEDWYMPVKSCRLTVKHTPLEQAGMNAFIALRKSPVQVKGETLGIGTGGRKTFQLIHSDGLKYDTLRLYYDNTRIYTEYEFNCEAGRVTCNAPEGVIVSCDYEYGWDNEDWQEMTLSSRISYDDYDQTEYRYAGASEGLSVCALKIVLSMTTGSITSERLGTSTGKSQSFRLSRRINDGKISVYASGSQLSAKNWTLLEDPQYIAVSAPAGKVITANYEWISDTPKVYEYYAVFSE